jgi:hypothetical protein
MSNANNNQQPTILVELKPRPGVQQVAITSEKLAELSAEALANATSTVQNMADWVNTTMDNLAGNPDEVEVEFGITLDVKGKALVAEVGAQAAIGIALTWKRGSGKSG